MSKAKCICFFTDILQLYKFLKKCVIVAFCLSNKYNANMLKRALIQQNSLATNDLINTIFQFHNIFVLYNFVRKVFFSIFETNMFVNIIYALCVHLIGEESSVDEYGSSHVRSY